MEVIKFLFSSFWIFIGMCILLSGLCNFLFLCWNRLWRHWTIRKHGYPPRHCDADGDLIETIKKAD